MTHPDIHRFGEQLAKRVDNRVPGWRSAGGTMAGLRSPPPTAVVPPETDSEVMPR